MANGHAKTGNVMKGIGTCDMSYDEHNQTQSLGTRVLIVRTMGENAIQVVSCPSVLGPNQSERVLIGAVHMYKIVVL